MRGATATNAMFSSVNDRQHVTLRVWSKTGSMCEETFPIEQATFADVKLAAIRHLCMNNSNNHNRFLLSSQNELSSPYRRSSFALVGGSRTSAPLNVPVDEAANYKLISIETKRIVDEEKTLNQERIRDGDEYLLATKRTARPSKTEQKTKSTTVDLAMIEVRTKDLPSSSHMRNRDYRSGARSEFRTDLNRILITLIETSQKLLWCRPDAETIFKQAEDLLLRSSSDESSTTTTMSTNISDSETRQRQTSKLSDMGFTEHQARIALKRTRYDIHAAMELLLSQPDIDGSDEDDDETNDDEKLDEQARNVIPPLFSRTGPFISFRQFRQQRFQPNSRAIQSLKEMGFQLEDIIAALRLFNNDKNLACEYLLGDKQQQQTLLDADNDQGLDPNSSIFQAIMQNPIVQRTLNNPKTFFVMLQISENPTSITNYLNDPDIGNMLLQISRIYHAEKDNMNPPATAGSNSSDHPEGTLSRATSVGGGGDFDDDSD